jgi:hypothetical protein
VTVVVVFNVPLFVKVPVTVTVLPAVTVTPSAMVTSASSNIVNIVAVMSSSIVYVPPIVTAPFYYHIDNH